MNLNLKDVRSMNVQFNLETNSIDISIEKMNNTKLILSVEELEGPLKQMALNLCKAVFSESFVLEKSFTAKKEEYKQPTVVDIQSYK